MKNMLVLIAVLISFSFSLADERQKRIEKFFQSHDQNNDGKISPDELEDEVAFKIFDKDQDGFISRSELLGTQSDSDDSDEMDESDDNTTEIQDVTTTQPNSNKLPKRFEKQDTNKDGKISKDEWKGPQERFTHLDKDQNGFVDANEAPKHDKENRKGDRKGDRKRGMGPQDRLKRLDTNEDGRISKDEWKGPEGLFTRLDKNGDGVISAQELPKGRPNHPRGPGKKGDNKFRDKLDADGDGKLSKDEWPGNPAMFQRFDKNQDGFISQDEIPPHIKKRFGGGKGNRQEGKQDRAMGILRKLHQMDENKDGKLSESEWQGPKRMFQNFDKNQDGFISKDELPQKLQKRIEKEQKNQGPKKRFMKFLEKMDSNKDGVITENEWDGPPRLFNAMDQNGDGKVTKEELRSMKEQRKRNKRDRDEE